MAVDVLTRLTETELADMRTIHRPLRDPMRAYCRACSDRDLIAWPCAVARLVAEVDRLRTLVDRFSGALIDRL